MARTEIEQSNIARYRILAKNVEAHVATALAYCERDAKIDAAARELQDAAKAYQFAIELHGFVRAEGPEINAAKAGAFYALDHFAKALRSARPSPRATALMLGW